EVRDLELHRLGAVRGRVGHRDRAGAGNLEVGGLVLVTVGVAADDHRLGPAGHQPRDVLDDDRLAEDDATEDVADRAVRAPPHLLETELLDAGLVRRDRGALDADAVLVDGVRRVDRDLVVGPVALFDPQVVVLEVHIEVRVDQLVLDELPDDAGHLVAVEFDDCALDLDLGHERRRSSRCSRRGSRVRLRLIPLRIRHDAVGYGKSIPHQCVAVQAYCWISTGPGAPWLLMSRNSGPTATPTKSSSPRNLRVSHRASQVLADQRLRGIGHARYAPNAPTAAAPLQAAFPAAFPRRSGTVYRPARGCCDGRHAPGNQDQARTHAVAGPARHLAGGRRHRT